MAPASTARRASSARLMPLTMNGPSHCERSQATSSHVGGGVPIHTPYASKNPGTGSSFDTGKFGTPSCGIEPDLSQSYSQRGSEQALGGVLDHRLEVHRLRDRRAAPVARVHERPVEREDHADRAGRLRPLHASDHRVTVARPVDLEQRLRVGGDHLVHRLRRERAQAHHDAPGSRRPARRRPRRRGGPLARRSG